MPFLSGDGMPVLKGPGFSRAVKVAKRMAASAAEVRLLEAQIIEECIT
jgi:hypothetical protein